jgi:hypothetical protein
MVSSVIWIFREGFEIRGVGLEEPAILLLEVGAGVMYGLPRFEQSLQTVITAPSISTVLFSSTNSRPHNSQKEDMKIFWTKTNLAFS